MSAVLLAAPTAAQAQIEVWSGTLTVRDSSGTLGCSNSALDDFCRVHLSDDDFTHDSTDYAIVTVWLKTNGQLQIITDIALTGATRALTLNVDGTAFAFKDANLKGLNTRTWNNSGLSWTAGDTVSLTLTEPNNIHSTTITVGGIGVVGYVEGGTGFITDATFDYNNVDYEIEALFHNFAGNLNIRFNNTDISGLSAVYFYVGGIAYPAASKSGDANSGTEIKGWYWQSDLSWTVGQTITVHIEKTANPTITPDPPTPPPTPARLAAGPIGTSTSPSRRNSWTRLVNIRRGAGTSMRMDKSALRNWRR